MLVFVSVGGEGAVVVVGGGGVVISDGGGLVVVGGFIFHCLEYCV